MQDNKERIAAAQERGTAPYWVRDNSEYMQVAMNGGGGSNTPPVATAVPNKAAIEKARRKEYEAFDDKQWHKEYYDDKSSGYVVIDKGRVAHGELSKRCRAVYDKEVAMSKVFAKYGYKIEMLDEFSLEIGNRHDVNFNGIPGELKRIEGTNNILHHSKKAIEKQGAKVVLFEFMKHSDIINSELNKLAKRLTEKPEYKDCRVFYFYNDEKIVRELKVQHPDYSG